MTDIVERLRWRATHTSRPEATTPQLCAEAADRIEKLEAALRPFASVTILPNGTAVGMERQWFTEARAALKDKP